jgi:phenylacetate-CoA ligase
MRLPPSGEQISVMARTRLAALFADAARTHFWTARLRDAGINAARLRALDAFAALRALPPVSARELRLAGWGALRDGWARPWWPSSRSSGSTGEPFRVYYDLPAWALLNHAVKLRARAACGITDHARVAMLETIPPSREGCSLSELVRPFQRISMLQPPPVIAEKLVLHHPSALCGRPSALLAAGYALEALGRRLPIRVLFTSGELLQPSARAALTGMFHAPVLDIYGTSETKEIAWECPFGGRHVNADVLHVEVLGPDGAALPTGEEGDIVVSVLVNRAMPLLRYRTGDRGYLLPDRCPCGCALPLLEIAGSREEETLELKGGRRVSPDALTTAIEQTDGAPQYQVSPLDRRRLRARAIPTASADRQRLDYGIRAAEPLGTGAGRHIDRNPS